MFDKYWNSELEDCVAVLVLPYGMNDLWRVGIRHAIRTLAEVAKKYTLRMYIRKVRESNMVSIDHRDVNADDNNSRGSSKSGYFGTKNQGYSKVALRSQNSRPLRPFKCNKDLGDENLTFASSLASD